ncbi:BPTI/Kunitz domain-containing protein [Sorangium sp. So ce1036]|uniref:BPTI/Kunitz domain-containing protein n=1 Tax=Sorangium sp. So ce1036 TaxID=3133328 RepID=UPI003F0CC14D
MLTSLLLPAACSLTINEGGSGGGGPGAGGTTAVTGGVGGSGGGTTTAVTGGVGGSGGGTTTAVTGGVGGSGGGTTTAVTSGVGGGGGLPDACTLPMEVGPCDAAFPKYWHDASTGLCKPFTYGGCEGNANRFDSLEECQQACQGGAPDMDACEAPGECMLAGPGCCGSCDPVDARAFVAINRAVAGSYEASTGCGDVACGPCPEVTEAERTSQYFTATCERGQCVVLDVRESPLTECTEDAECMLRNGLGCCEGCSGEGIVAINRNADLAALVCPDGPVACPACAPIYPPGTAAVCVEGRCQPSFKAP